MTDDDDKFWELVSPLDELFQAGINANEAEDYSTFADKLESLVIDKIFLVELPITGQDAIQAAKGLQHWMTEGCKICEEGVRMFGVSAITLIWSSIMQQTGMLDDE